MSQLEHRRKTQVSLSASTEVDKSEAKKDISRKRKPRKRERNDNLDDLAERNLTAFLFGHAESSSPLEKSPDRLENGDMNSDDEEDEVLEFMIDRTCMVDTNTLDSKVDDQTGQSKKVKICRQPKKEQQPAWNDPDDFDSTPAEYSSKRLLKLRLSRSENSTTRADLNERLRKRYEGTAQKSSNTVWASISRTQANDEESHEAISSSGTVLASSKKRLPPNILDIVRCPNANLGDPSHSVIQAVHFHPGSDPDAPLMLTAGLDKTLRFFQVGVEKSEKIHGIHFPKMPIHTASFLGNTGNVVVSGRRPFFYLYDAVTGKLDFVPRIVGREEKSWEKHVVSPDGKVVAFLGNDGYIVLVNPRNKQWIGDLRLNGSVRAVTFSSDGEQILASGSDGDVYRWDISTRRCIERFSNNDGTTTSSIAASSTRVAVGAQSGVVNLYGGNIEQENPNLHKSIMNLRTSADGLSFNHDGQILAMMSRREQHGLKLLHVSSNSIFSNWPTSKTPLRYVWSMDFSPQSKFLAIGNDKGECLLYQLSHYHKE